MIKYKEIEKKVIKKEVEYIECDKCHQKFNPMDTFEFQEIQTIWFTGGYGSVFGDESEIQCNLCQNCLKDLIGKYCRILDEEDNE